MFRGGFYDVISASIGKVETIDASVYRVDFAANKSLVFQPFDQ